jgi:hypothetical protein
MVSGHPAIARQWIDLWMDGPAELITAVRGFVVLRLRHRWAAGALTRTSFGEALELLVSRR